MRRKTNLRAHTREDEPPAAILTLLVGDDPGESPDFRRSSNTRGFESRTPLQVPSYRRIPLKSSHTSKDKSASSLLLFLAFARIGRFWKWCQSATLPQKREEEGVREKEAAAAAFLSRPLLLVTAKAWGQVSH